MDEFRTPEQLFKDVGFIEKYVIPNGYVRNRIIREYLQGLYDGAPPVTVSFEGRSGVSSPRVPKSIAEAGLWLIKNNI